MGASRTVPDDPIFLAGIVGPRPGRGRWRRLLHLATPAKRLSRVDGPRCQILPDWSGTSRALHSTRPCRARDIMTDKILASSAIWAGGPGVEVRQAAFLQPDHEDPVELLAFADVPGQKLEPGPGQERATVACPYPGGHGCRGRAIVEQVGGPGPARGGLEERRAIVVEGTQAELPPRTQKSLLSVIANIAENGSPRAPNGGSRTPSRAEDDDAAYSRPGLVKEQRGTAGHAGGTAGGSSRPCLTEQLPGPQ